MALTETTDTGIPGRHRADPSRPGAHGVSRVRGRSRDGLNGRERAHGRSRLRERMSGRERDRGQTAIEGLGMTPLIILLGIALWQCALIGYTFSLAGNAADQAAHQGAITEGTRTLECQEAARKDLPDAWEETMRTTCRRTSSGMYTAQVRLKVPVLAPGVLNWPFTVTGHGAYPMEG
ncbi:pilus assembly protein [Streptomyces sp. NPDC014744]|uniref:pilus assembly protein n=1 Tax=Streptomyces sp. NPDC014744 TaxID=3364903 RepID=UPI0036FBD1E5